MQWDLVCIDACLCHACIMTVAMVEDHRHYYIRAFSSNKGSYYTCSNTDGIHATTMQTHKHKLGYVCIYAYPNLHMFV